MGWFGFGKKKEKEAAPAPVVDTRLQSDGPMTSAQFGMQMQTPSEMVGDDSFKRLRSSPPPRPSTAYNPYAGLPATTLDPGMLEKLYNLPEQPEFLFAEEAGVRHRNMGENFTFCTGVGYFGGGLMGGMYGAYAGLRSSPEGGVDTPKLRVNRVLNAASNRGTSWGNNLGCLGMFFALSDSLLCWGRGNDDVLNQFAAGTLAGLVYKLPAGPRPMLVYGSALGMGFGLLSTANALYRGRQLIAF